MRLHGWRQTRKSSTGGMRLPKIDEISILDAVDAPSIGVPKYPDIPWQISRHAMVKLPIARAFHARGATIVIGDSQARAIRIHGIFYPPGEFAAGRAALGGVMRNFPDREFFAREIFPENLGIEIFGPLGFAREPLNQVLMRRHL